MENKKTIETIEIPHEEYTTPSDIKRVNDELKEEADQ